MYADGTFYSSPGLLFQMYTIHAEILPDLLYLYLCTCFSQTSFRLTKRRLQDKCGKPQSEPPSSDFQDFLETLREVLPMSPLC